MKSKYYVVFVVLVCICLFPVKVFADTMVPARLVLENSGFTVQWDGQGVTAANGEKTVNIPLNKNIVLINNTSFEVDQPAVKLCNQMFISQKILDLLGIMDNQNLSYSSPDLTIQANTMSWDIKSCTDPAEYYTANSSYGVHWLVPDKVSKDLIGSIFNYFSYCFNQSNNNRRLASNAHRELITGFKNGKDFIYLPVEERLSRAVINFDSSNANNKNNMNAVVALEYLDGQKVPPGKVFSYNKAVGPRTIKRGFYVGHSISGEKMIPDIGGGVCRASTALYNAVLDANLPVIERHPHTVPVSYVPKGRDAAVAWDIYDFKFRNDREFPITISTQGSLTQLVVEIWRVIPPRVIPKVILDGKQLSFEVPPTIENGRTLVPLRAIFESLGAKVDWDGNTKTVTAAKAGIKVKLQIGVKTAYKNGSPVALDIPAKIINDRVLVPLRFVSEALGAEVDWDDTSQTKTITISSTSPGNSVKSSMKQSGGTLEAGRETNNFTKVQLKLWNTFGLIFSFMRWW